MEDLLLNELKGYENGFIHVVNVKEVRKDVRKAYMFSIMGTMITCLRSGYLMSEWAKGWMRRTREEWRYWVWIVR